MVSRATAMLEEGVAEGVAEGGVAIRSAGSRGSAVVKQAAKDLKLHSQNEAREAAVVRKQKDVEAVRRLTSLPTMLGFRRCVILMIAFSCTHLHDPNVSCIRRHAIAQL